MLVILKMYNSNTIKYILIILSQGKKKKRMKAEIMDTVFLDHMKDMISDSSSGTCMPYKDSNSPSKLPEMLHLSVVRENYGQV